MSMTDQLEQARDLLASHDAILFALLFGSMATGYTHPWSDVDIGVYVTTPLSLLEAGKLTAALERLVERDVDLLVLSVLYAPVCRVSYRRCEGVERWLSHLLNSSGAHRLVIQRR